VEITSILRFQIRFIEEEKINMNAELKELNRLLCKNCDKTKYEDCKRCRVYQLINSLASKQRADVYP